MKASHFFDLSTSIDDLKTLVSLRPVKMNTTDILIANLGPSSYMTIAAHFNHPQAL